MEDNKITLRSYLDQIGVHSGDDRGFVVLESPFSRTEMNVSRRYLESEPWKHLLDYYIHCVQRTEDIYGQYTLLFVLEKPEEKQ